MTPLRTLFLCATALLAAACVFPDGPSNDEVKTSTGLTVAEAERTLLANLYAVWPAANPQLTRPIPRTAERIGCRNTASMTSYGPPWWLRATATQPNPSPELIDEVLSRLDAMTAQGFTRQPPGVVDNHPADRDYRDARGYTITSDFTPARDANTPARLDVTVTSPCAAE
ncbi:hypothetical protein [Nocardia sp. NPDC052566]|uniref:hypothetical protein n=1 Tax=Nocardia sp. NPDC052566 TaxID=3364330 RepID=UPI0037C9142D